MKTAVSVPDELFEAAERQAQRTKKSRSQLYAEALAEYLARHAPDEVTEAGNPSGGRQWWGHGLSTWSNVDSEVDRGDRLAGAGVVSAWPAWLGGVDGYRARHEHDHEHRDGARCRCEHEHEHER